MIIVDYSGISIAQVFSMKLDFQENVLRHMILNSLRMYNVKYRDEYGQMVIALDGGAAWRREIYPHYKAQRAKGRAESGLNWAEFFRVLNIIEQEIRENLPYRMVGVRGCEADDVIATIVDSTQEFGKNEPVMIISSDHDFIQLQKYKNVSQFSPLTRKLIKERDPVKALREKILRGDGGDGVPNVLSPDDTFITGARQRTLQSKRVNEFVAAWNRLPEVMDAATLKNFQRNQAMIDMSKIPEPVRLEILNTFEAVKPAKSNVLNYLISKRCAQLIECAEEFNPHDPKKTS